MKLPLLIALGVALTMVGPRTVSGGGRDPGETRFPTLPSPCTTSIQAIDVDFGLRHVGESVVSGNIAHWVASGGTNCTWKGEIVSVAVEGPGSEYLSVIGEELLPLDVSGGGTIPLKLRLEAFDPVVLDVHLTVAHKPKPDEATIFYREASVKGAAGYYRVDFRTIPDRLVFDYHHLATDGPVGIYREPNNREVPIYREGSLITLSADPIGTFPFGGWHGDIRSDSRDTSFRIHRNMSIVAAIRPPLVLYDYSARVANAVNVEVFAEILPGSALYPTYQPVNASWTMVPYGGGLIQQVRFECGPPPPSGMSGYSGSGDEPPGVFNVVSDTEMEWDVGVGSAYCDEWPEPCEPFQLLKLYANPTLAGSFSVDDENVSIGSVPTRVKHPYGQQAKLEAIPNPGYVFSYWSGSTIWLTPPLSNPVQYFDTCGDVFLRANFVAATDAMEPNDSIDTPFVLELGSPSSLSFPQLTLTEEDWYRLRPSGALRATDFAALKIGAAFDQRLGDLQLQLWDRQGAAPGSWGSLIKSGTPTAVGEELELNTSLGSSELYLRVYAEPGSANMSYALTIDLHALGDSLLTY